MRLFLPLIFLILGFGPTLFAQQPQPTAQERAVQISAAVQTNPARITLNWKADSGASKYVIHRKSLAATTWGNPIANLSGSATSYADNNVQIGVGYEYAIFKEDFSYYETSVCVPSGTPLRFTINDSNGIGLCCSFGNGFYEVENCNNIVAAGDDFGNTESTTFTACNDGAGCSDIFIKIKPSMIDNSTSWSLQNSQTGQQYGGAGGAGQFLRPRPEYGFIYAGIQLPVIENRGRILLVIENDLFTPLAAEIEELKMDLIKDGWRVSGIGASRIETVGSVHNRIKDVYNANPDLKAVLLLGHVPVPFSGSIFPDTHTENEGAYPADVFYGEMNGTWTDNQVNTTAPYLSIYHNVPNDGKFDQAVPPSGVVELQVGRVDFFDMPSFGQTEIQLMQQYLAKNHQFKTRQINPTRRALMDDNIGQTIGAPAASGYRNFATFFGHTNIAQADYISTMNNQSYLWSYGAGSGNSTSADGIGTTTDFSNNDLQNVFTMLFGSQFGNWAFANSLLRAPLASGQTLTSCYAGNPPWTLHHMAMGYPIGYGLEKTQNNPNDLYSPTGPALVSTALMGDPTLRMHMVKAPTNLQVSNTSNAVNLNWNAPTNETVAGYHIYRAASVDGDFQRINNNTITATSFSDNAPLTGDNFYLVKTLKLETSGSGTYYNLSLGTLGNTNFSGTGGDTTPPTASLATNSNNVNTAFVVNVFFSENINGLTLADFNVSNGTKSNLTGSASFYSFTVTPNNAGLVTIVLPSQRVKDAAGNPNNQASNTLNITYTVVDNTPPTATLTTTNNNVSTSFLVNVNFSENINGLTLIDFNVTNGTKSNLTGNGSSFSFIVMPNNAGLVTVVLPSQRVTDVAGNPNSLASNILNITYSPNTGTCNTPTNLALNKPATQHSVQFGASADRANDGNTSGDFWVENSVSLTNWTPEAWWEVDLGAVADITEIKVYNRTECCQDILNNYNVLISDNPFSSTSLTSTINQSGVTNFPQNVQAGTPSNIPVNQSGRYVRIQLSDQGFMALAEVEVMGCFANGTVQNQTITFNSIPNKQTTDAPFSLNASSTSGLPISYSLVSGPATISGNTLTLNGGSGTVTIRASQAGNTQYNAAPNVTQTFTVSEPSTGGCSNPTNIALGKTATQSGTQLSAEAGRAVDGNTEGNFWGAPTTTLTNWQDNAWWQVDLEEISDIQSINLWNRTDCCDDFFGNFYVLVSDVPIVSNNLITARNQAGVSSFLFENVAGRPSTIPINRTGQFVRVQLVGSSFLAISEVEIIGCTGGGSGCPTAGTPCNDNNAATENDVEDGNCNCAGTLIGTGCGATSNVALNKTATQSSTLTALGITGNASKAVDGNTNGVYFITPSSASSVSATNNENQAWWQVDLGSNHTLENIKVFNRTDGSDRTQNAYVLVSNNAFTSSGLATARSQATFEYYISGLVGSPTSIPLDVDGRYVRVQMEGSGHLVLGEVEVEGCASNNFNNNINALISMTQVLDFQAVKEERSARLIWSSNDNARTKYFEVEKSLDGEQFEFLEKIENSSNALGFEIHEIMDEELVFGENFYRLKLTQADGSIVFSEIQNLRLDADWSQVFLFPNPAKNEIRLNLEPLRLAGETFFEKNIQVELYDARGVLLQEYFFEKLENGTPVFDLSNFENGLHLMTIKMEGVKMLVRKFVVEKGN